MNKTKILILIILFLFVTNVATIITGIALTSTSKISDAPVSQVSARERMGFYNDHLGLTRDQRSYFMDINRNYNREARLTTVNIENLRFRMIDELAAENPDMGKIDTICHDIGMLHTRLKRSTVDYYINLKEIFNEDQKERLYELFRGMADPETDMNKFGHGRGSRQGMNRGRGMMRMGNDDIKRLNQRNY